MRANPTKIGARLAEKMSQRVILVVLVLFVGILLVRLSHASSRRPSRRWGAGRSEQGGCGGALQVMQLNELVDLGPEAGLDWMDALRVNTTVHPSSIPTTVWDTPKSNRLLVPHVAANTYVLGIEQPVLCERPSIAWAVLTEIYRCYACSCQEILRVMTARQASRTLGHVVSSSATTRRRSQTAETSRSTSSGRSPAWCLRCTTSATTSSPLRGSMS